MHISRLCVRNFRNFRAATFHFQEGVNTLIGENGSGKTNAFHAIRLLLDDSLVRRATQLKESDFNRSNGNWKGHWIVISIDFQKLDSSEGCQILKHTTGHMNGTDSGSYTFYFRPKRDVRSALHAASGNEDAVREILSSLTLDEYESVFTGRSTADFCSDAIYTSVVGDFVSLQFPSPDNDDSSILGTSTFQSIDREVSCTFVKALRDVVNDLRNYRDSPLLNLLRGAEKEISLADAGRIVTSIRDLNKDISSLGEIRELSLGIQSTLHDTAGYSYAPTIDIKSSLPDDIERLLQGLSLRVGNLVAVFRDNSHSGFLFRSYSTDSGRTWTKPITTNFPDATSKVCGLRLHDGRYVLVSNSNPKRRDPLTLAISADGIVFNELFYLVGERQVDYPHVIEHDNSLLIAFSGGKQTVEVLRISLQELSPH